MFSSQYRKLLALTLCVVLFVPAPAALAYRGGGHHGGHGGGHHGGHGGGHHGGFHGGGHHHHGGGWHHGVHHGHYGHHWHPIGFMVTTLAVTAIIVSASNHHDYHYDQGVYYVPSGGGYKVVPAPMGATVPSLPPNSVQVMVGSMSYFYYGGDFYVPKSDMYKVVPAPPGAVVSSVPDGTNTVVVNGGTYFQYGDTYYEAESSGGDVVYTVVRVSR